MVLDYLTIPGKYCTIISRTTQLTNLLATSIDMEHLFSCGHLIVMHTYSHLLAQTTHTVLCLGAWSQFNLVKTEDTMAVAALRDVKDFKIGQQPQTVKGQRNRTYSGNTH